MIATSFKLFTKLIGNHLGGNEMLFKFYAYYYYFTKDN